MTEIAELNTDNEGRRTVRGGKLRVAILGATGMVGQNFIRMLREHPWFEIKVLAASSASAGQTYGAAVRGRWAMEFPMPDALQEVVLQDAADVEIIAAQADIAFCAVSLDKSAVKELEDAYARAGVWLTSNNSAFRGDALTPMVMPAVNPQHLDVVNAQRRARGYTTGGIIVKSNCSIQSYVTALEPLKDAYGLRRVRVHSEQAISGAGKTFTMWPEMVENMIPHIGGEELKSEIEPLKIWGQATPEGIVSTDAPHIRAKCVRIAVAHGHTAYVTAYFDRAPMAEEVLTAWQNYARSADMPSAPRQLITYRPEPDRPQPRLDVMAENGMGITIGQLRVDASDNSIEFTALAHNAILGAAGGAMWATETALARGLIYRRV